MPTTQTPSTLILSATVGGTAISSNDNVSEATGTVAVTATMDEAAPADVTVALHRDSGTATLNTDYTLPPTITIAADAMSGSADIAINDDALDEVDEGVTFTAATSAGLTANLTSTAFSFTITDNDDPPLDPAYTNHITHQGDGLMNYARPSVKITYHVYFLRLQDDSRAVG